MGAVIGILIVMGIVLSALFGPPQQREPTSFAHPPPPQHKPPQQQQQQTFSLAQHQDRERERAAQKQWEQDAQERQREEQERQQRELERQRQIYVSLGEPLVLRGHAKFRAGRYVWTSSQAKVAFAATGCRATEDVRIRIVKHYQQASREDPSQFAMPQFREEEVDRLTEFARDVFLRRLRGENRYVGCDDNDDRPEYDEDKAHEQHLCERCKELGYNCTRRINRRY